MQRRTLPAELAAVLAVLAASSSASRAIADSAPPPTYPPDHRTYFAQLFPNPTGRNGFEDLIAAADLLSDDDAFDAAAAKDPTLTQKRAALADPNCRRALALIRDGLSKPQALTHGSATDDATTRHASLMPFVRLGRLLAVEQYVYLADGRTGAAIDSLSDALRVPDIVRGDAVIGALAGMLDDTYNLKSITGHRSQWSKADCDHVIHVVRDRLASQPHLGFATLESWRTLELRMVDDWITAMKTDAWGNLAGAILPDMNVSVDMLRAQWQQVGSDPASLAALPGQIRLHLNAKFDQAEGRGGVAAGAPTPDAAPAPGAPASALASTVTSMMVDPAGLKRFVDEMTDNQTLLQLLGADAVVRRYRCWEYGYLPAGLADVGMPDLTIDPSTGAPFRYRRTPDGADYTLTSDGPLAAVSNIDFVAARPDLRAGAGDTAGHTAIAAAAFVPALLDAPTSAAGGQPDGPVLPALFPHPTGRNGYEDLVTAGDLLLDSAAYRAATDPEATLSGIDVALDDPVLRRSIALVASGLGKPLSSPRAGASVPEEAPAPDLALLRELARLLGARQYALLAGGRSAAAIDVTREMVEMPDAVHDDSPTAVAVGAAIDEYAINLFAIHSGQWTAADCVTIIQFARERLGEDSGADRNASVALGQREQAIVHLLATQAAICRYRWEYDRLPQQLSDLNMPDITTDPYTDKPLTYQPAADGCSGALASAGRTDGKASGGTAAVSVPIPLPSTGIAWR